MCPDTGVFHHVNAARRIQRQAGLGLVGAIFLIVVVSMLALVMSRMLQTDAKIYSYEILALKAFYAADSGAQLGVNRAMPPSGGSTCADRNFDFTDPPMASCSAQVTCESITAGGEEYLTLTSTGVCIAGSTRAERRLQVRIKP